MARNILQMALPMTVAQLINILYNIVDRMYLGRLPGHLSLTGLGLCLPIISILMGFANLCGMGGAPLCSIHRGKGENEEAERILGNSFTLLLLFGGGLTVFCLAFRRPILYLFGASDLTFPYANDYLTIYLLGTLFVMIGLGMNPFINAQGFSRMGMMTVALGAAVNIVLDPIFIFALDMGVRGAALATVLAQGCSALWVLKFLTGRRALLRLRWNTLRLQAARVRRILALGTSGFVMSMTNSLVQVLCNASLQHYGGDLYVGVMTVINSIREVVSMPVQGITNGCQPVLGYNYGAGEYDRVKKLYRTSMGMCAAIMAAGTVLCLALSGQLIGLFSSNAETIVIGTSALRIICVGFIVSTISVVASGSLEGLGMGVQSLVISLCRYIIVIMPLAWLFCRLLGADGIWNAFWVTEVITAGISMVVYHKSVKLK